jgi:hypothetical protein
MKNIELSQLPTKRNMYLAPFNYDRFFQRLFKDPAIAKRFFEDYLNRKNDRTIKNRRFK